MRILCSNASAMANTGSVRCLASNTFFTATFVNIEVSPRQCLGIHLIGGKAAPDTIHLNQSTLRSSTRRTISRFLRTGTDIPGLLMTYGSTGTKHRPVELDGRIADDR